MVFSSLLFLYIYLPVVLAVYLYCSCQMAQCLVCLSSIWFFTDGASRLHPCSCWYPSGSTMQCGLLIDNCRDRDKRRS